MNNLSLGYNEIMKEYDSIRAKNSRILNNRYSTIIKELPEYKALEDEIIDLSVQIATSKLLTPNEDVTASKALVNELKAKKSEILISNGYPADYLTSLYDCALCQDTGYVNNEKCKCLLSKLIKLRYHHSHLDEVLDKENFNTFSFDYFEDEEKIQKLKVFNAAKDFVENFDNDFKNLLFFGEVGTGKTFLSNCIAKELLDKGKTVIYFTAPGLFETIGSSFKKNSDIDTDSFYDDIFNCDLLILDDIGTESYNSFTVGQFFIILNERLTRHKSTVISTNLDIQGLNDTYSERSVSRILGGYDMFQFKGHDMRLLIRNKDKS